MTNEFLKFPTTPHLIWLAKECVRDDKVFTQTEAEEFLSKPVLIEEKIDGANLGFSFDSQGNLQAQNRNTLIQPGTKGQFATLWEWLSRHETGLLDILSDRLILFGEWCYACHSIHYTKLPDFFLVFDIFDKQEKRFMNSTRRDEIVSLLKLNPVPKLYHGILSLSDIPRVISQSSLYNGPMEGIYIRQENKEWLMQRAKVVRPEFVQQIHEHWSKHGIIPNYLNK